MTKSSYFDEWFKKIDTEELEKRLKIAVIDPFIEVYRSFYDRKDMIILCAFISGLVQISFLAGLDYAIFKYLKLKFLYPEKLLFRIPYLTFFFTMSFYFWGFYRLVFRLHKTRRLTTAFIDSDLKSPSGKLPALISDTQIDHETRMLRLKLNGVPREKFKENVFRDNLQVEVDHIDFTTESGAVNVYYSHSKLPEMCGLEAIDVLENDQFFIGRGRAKNIVTDLKDCPHYLIGGTTGGGKTYFIAQMITTLYLNNKNYTFELIDLKSGAELENRFSGLPRIKVYNEASSAAAALNKIAEKELNNRSLFLKLNNCFTIDDLNNMAEKDIVTTHDIPIKKKFGRMIIVVDEAHALFLKNDKNNSEEAIQARNSMIKLSALGRSVGIHVVVGTQRPDAKAVDPLIKANLTASICFRMPNHASSMTILDNGRASHLPNIKGRCIWKISDELVEVQSYFLSNERLKMMLNNYYITSDSKADATSNDVKGSPSTKQNASEYVPKNDPETP